MEGTPTAGEASPIDAAEIVRSVRERFRPLGGRFVATAGALSASADESGALELSIPAGVGAADRPSAAVALRLGPAELRIGDAAVSAGRADVAEDGVLFVERGAVVERWHHRGRQLEQTFHFAQRPREGAELVVRIPVSGAADVAVTEAGVHFGPGEGAPGIRYGHGTFIDADGARTDVPASWEAGAITLRVPAEVVARSAFPAVLDPLVTAEQDADAPVVNTGSASGFQQAPVIAFNGSVYLVVWEDSRSLATSGTDIWGAIVGSGGSLITPFGFIICSSTGHQTSPAVDDDGTDFFVAWTDGRDAMTQGNDVYGTFVTNAGVVETPDGFPIVATGGQQQEPTVAYGGSNRFVVAWSGDSQFNGRDVYAQRYLRDAGVFGSTATLSGATGDQTFPAATSFANNVVFVAWLEQSSNPRDLTGTLYNTSTGTALVPYPVANYALNPGASAPAVASNGAGAIVLWGEGPTLPSRLRGKRIFADGGVQDALPLQVAITDAGIVEQPSAAWDGARYSVAFVAAAGSNDRVFGLKFNPADAGTTSPDLWASQGTAPALASAAPTGTFMVWEDRRDGPQNPDIYGAGVSQAPNPPMGGFPGIVISRSNNAQRSPAAVHFDGQYVLIWDDNRKLTSAPDLFSMTVDGAGAPTRTLATPLRDSPAPEQLPLLAAGADGGLLVFAHGTGSAIRPLAAALLPDGGLTTPQMVIDAPVAIRDLSWNGKHFVASFLGGTAAMVTRLSPDGTPLDPMGVALPGGPGREAPRVAAAQGESALAAWSDPQQGDVLLVPLRVTDAGVTAATPIPLSYVGLDRTPALASDGTDFLVAWGNIAGSTEGENVVAAIVRADGGVGTPIVVAGGAGNQGGPTAIFDGKRYAIVYQQGSGLTPTELVAQWVDTNGEVLPGGPFVVHDAGMPDTREVSLATDREGAVLVAYSQFHPVHQSERLSQRVLRFAEVGGKACTTNLDCDSNACVDGFCCDQACGGNNPDDCQACSVAAGASANGVCTIIAKDTKVCRAASTAAEDVCDVAETCDGVNPECPVDAVKPNTEQCRAAAGPCDVAETCDGTHKTCPANALLGTDATCRAAAGPCDAEEKCDGSTVSCPPDALSATGTVCRAAQSSCDVEETCSGTDATCPSDSLAADGVSCSEVRGGTCQAGSCSATKETSHYALLSCGAVAAGPTGLGWLGLIAVGSILLGRRGSLRRRALQVARRAARHGVLLGALLAVAALIGMSSEARAEEPTARKLTFFGLKAGTGVNAAEAESLSNYIQSELTRLEVYDVMGPSEVEAIIGAERQRQLLGCSEDSSSCLAEISAGLNADRGVMGDVSVVGDFALLNLSLLDPLKGTLIKRVGRKVEGKSASVLLESVQAAVIEMVSADPANAGKTLKVERGFGGVLVGVRGDGDVLGIGFAPGLMAELSGRRFGGAVTVLMGRSPAVRGEARFFPAEFGIVRPYLAAGATVFAPDVGVRGAAGAAVRFGQVHVFADAAYERFLNARATETAFRSDAVLLGAGAGWLF